jgi:hypothetical protein
LEVDGYRVAVALLSFYLFIVTTAGNLASPGIVGVIAGIGALWLFQCELLGISIDSQTLTMPTRQNPWMLALSYRRRTVLLSEVHRLTISARWFGFEEVRISGDFGWDLLFFASTDQRRRFIALIQSICPGVAVYRIRSPSDGGRARDGSCQPGSLCGSRPSAEIGATEGARRHGVSFITQERSIEDKGNGIPCPRLTSIGRSVRDSGVP